MRSCVSILFVASFENRERQEQTGSHGMVDMRLLFKQMPRNRSLTRTQLVEIETDRALMTGTPQHSLHATVPHRAVWRVACKLNPCT